MIIDRIRPEARWNAKRSGPQLACEPLRKVDDRGARRPTGKRQELPLEKVAAGDDDPAEKLGLGERIAEVLHPRCVCVVRGVGRSGRPNRGLTGSLMRTG